MYFNLWHHLVVVCVHCRHHITLIFAFKTLEMCLRQFRYQLHMTEDISFFLL